MSHVLKARRLPRQPGPAAWNRLLPEPPPPRPLEQDATVDIAIIGAGFAGLSAARRLSQIDRRIKVAVLEAGRLADGPAGRNSGFMIDLPHDLSAHGYVDGDAAAGAHDQETWLNRAAITFAAGAAQELDMPKEVFDPCGKINGAATDSGDRLNREYGQHLACMDEPYRLLDREEMAALTGTPYYTSGLYTPGTVMLQPAAYIRELAAGLPPSVIVHELSPVREIRQHAGDWRLSTSSASVTASKVILANNGHAESFGLFRGRLLHVFTYASMTDPIPEGTLGGEPRWGLTPANAMGTTVRRFNGVGGDRIIVRSRFTCNPSMTVSDAAIDRVGASHDRKFKKRFPMLKNVAMAYRWAGHLCLSLNGVPAHGEIEPGLFAAVCQNGLGTAKGTLAGISAAELAAGMRTDITRAMVEMDPPRRLPPEPLATVGANVTMRWKEWRAGGE